MTADDINDAPGAEVVPLHAAPDPAAAEVAPAEAPREDVQSAGERPVIYADITTAGERRPVIPERYRRENLRGTVGQWAGLQSHRTRYHGLRFPLYLVAMLAWAVIGAGRVIVRLVIWWWVIDLSALMNEAAADGDGREYRSLLKAATERRKVRGAILAGSVTGAAGAVAALIVYGPWWSQAAAAAVAVVLLARAGRPDGHRIIAPAVIPPQYTEPTPEVITRALASLGISAINQVVKADPGHSFCITPVMQSGPGWLVQIDLPHGVTAGDIIAKRPALASGLRRPLSATWPGGVPAEHEGRLELWVGFHDISKSKPPRWPLARAGQADVFAGIPFGTDPRLRPVTAPMFEVNWLIGAAPGQGKTAAVRALALGTALDPMADMWVHELAGKGDLEPLAQVCHRYISGLDDDAIAYAAQSANWLRGELARRSKAFGRLAKDVKPEGKITRVLAAHGFRPLVAVFDEVQNLFMHPEFGELAADDLAYVIRLGRALGIIVILATQRPDKDSLPTAIRGIVTARFCLKVPDYDSNDMILGTGAYKAGYNAAIFRAKTDAGLGWLKADGDPQIVRTYYLDLPAAERIAARARVMRERAGVLTGHALGLDDAGRAAPRDVLADVLAVFRDGEPGQHWDVLAERLAERWPDRWAGLSHTALSAQCRALGVSSVTVSVGGSKDKGCRKVAVEQAVSPAVSAQVSDASGNRS
ncbi:MAG: cell division protein FtsK [Streptosporangiaceae bacterium]